MRCGSSNKLLLIIIIIFNLENLQEMPNYADICWEKCLGAVEDPLATPYRILQTIWKMPQEK
jgi:hypothetical protein